jgi:serine/threonine-protein kinase RsbW/sigma-B regulation protein RsbU (phosphoserine phosphatase)
MHGQDGDQNGRHPGRDAAHRLSLALRNDLSEIPRLALAVERFGIDHRVAVETIDELVTNVIRYAHTDGAMHEIAVVLVLSDGRITVDIVDDGHPFDPLERATPDIDAPLEERPIGGLGIHFVRSLMDEVGYRRDGHKNVVRLAKTVKFRAP